MSKRRKGFPSETQVKRGQRVVNAGKELSEKLGRNDPCLCGSGRRFQKLLYAFGPARWKSARRLLQVKRALIQLSVGAMCVSDEDTVSSDVESGAAFKRLAPIRVRVGL